ncbi:hypothetical protein AVEN_98792-1 [Araneus ventricosus]|uniref:Uncharacterized protein n=1 Tax=Araneus ventricosus TaxID=182803 RepID=A0A4Y2I835_ARAVE|nr:hypothetical protein AVEN_98792-1 [Araneus ventricosus]
MHNRRPRNFFDTGVLSRSALISSKFFSSIPFCPSSGFLSLSCFGRNSGLRQPGWPKYPCHVDKTKSQRPSPMSCHPPLLSGWWESSVDLTPRCHIWLRIALFFKNALEQIFTIPI